MEALAFERTLTELDHVRLTHLMQRQKRGSAALPIENLLDVADIVHWRQAPADLVTMHSRVLLKNPRTGEHSELTLCYPADADMRAGYVSVLSPVGFSLLGQKAGAVVRWPTPSGIDGEAEILQILFQPESSGDFAM